MSKNNKIFLLTLFIILNLISCQIQRPKRQQNYYKSNKPKLPRYPNCFQQKSQHNIKIQLYKNQKLISSQLQTIKYTVDQQLYSYKVNLTLSQLKNQNDNITLVASLIHQNSNNPLSISIGNITKYKKVKNSANAGMAMQFGMTKNQDKLQNQTQQYDLHIAAQYQILVLHQQVPLFNGHQYMSIFGFQMHNGCYSPSLDQSQMRIPYKTYKPISSINQTYQLQIKIQIYPTTRYMMFIGMTDKQFIKRANPLMADVYDDATIDMIKQVIFGNSFYLVLGYFILSIAQSFMQIFAFKQQIKIWRKIQNNAGLSIKSLYRTLACQIIIVLYLHNAQASNFYLFFQVLSLIMTIWKITRAIDISISTNNKYIIKMEYKQWYHRKVQNSDTQAMHYTTYLIGILFIFFMCYKLYNPVLKFYYLPQYQVYIWPSIKQIYTFSLQCAVGFIFVFGFVMMTPQIYINYKLKSVDHLPWKTLIYRFIATIIDDIFVFMVDVPTMTRAFSFRDDVIFIIYLIQRRIYRVDKNRLAMSSGSIDLRSNRSGLQCLNHPNEQITNYCIHLQCLTPLCPDCVQQHTKNGHQFQQIQSWKHCVNKSARSVKNTLDNLRNIYNQNNQYQIHKSVQQVQAENLRRLANIKQKLLSMIDNVFSNYQAQLRNVIRQTYKLDPPDLTKLKSAIDQLQKILMKLGHSTTVLPALKKSLLLDHQSLNSYFGNMQYRTKTTQLNQVYVMQTNDISNLRPYIQNLININSGVQYTQQVKTNIPYGTNYNNYNLYGTPSKPFYQNNNNIYNHNYTNQNILNNTNNNIPTQLGSCKINIKNYFNQNCMQKNLHFFVPSRKQLKILPINDNILTNRNNWQTLPIRSKNQLTSYHKSIVTPNGDIYYTGGGYDNGQKIRQIYRYNYDKKSLQLICKMLNARSSHSLCYMNQCIYIIGGFTSKGSTAQCQVFRLNSQSCQPIAPLNTPSASQCCISFNDQFILKFGGIQEYDEQNILQIYILSKNKWMIMNIVGQQPQFTSFSAGVQISNQIVLFFGGYNNAQNQKPQKTCFALKIDPKQLKAYVLNFNQSPLLLAEGFWSNQAIIHNGKVLAIQNVAQGMSDSQTLDDQRRLLIFNGSKWI